MKKVAIAFQGNGFAGGALASGTVKRLVEEGAFDKFDIDVFSGTSSGALVAAVCWGHKLQDTIEDLPEVLWQQWMHFASGTIPTPGYAEALELAIAVAQTQPLYQVWSRYTITPFLRGCMEEWVLRYIPIEDLNRLRKTTQKRDVPRLLIGAANILSGKAKYFTEDNFELEGLLASGSLDETIGRTEIKTGPDKGSFLDGAWATNPPLRPLLDYKIDELWLVQAFPQNRKTEPQTPAEMHERKNELWQNSLVEAELYHIQKVNEWLKEGRLDNPDHKFRHIEIKPMLMNLDLQAGSTFVNDPSAIQGMMDYGYRNAPVLLGRKPDPFQSGDEDELNSPVSTWPRRCSIPI